VGSPLSDGEWHRLHPLTPLFRGGLFLVVVIGIVIANLRDRLIDVFLPWMLPDMADEELPPDAVDYVLSNNLVLVVLLTVLGIAAALVAIFYLSWRFHTFRITDDDVEVRSVVLFPTYLRGLLLLIYSVCCMCPMLVRS